MTSLAPSMTNTAAKSHLSTNPSKRSIIKKTNLWTEQEDQLLRVLVEKIGKKWVEIASYFPDKNNNACRKRYLNNVDPTLIHGPITPDEIRQIQHLVTKHKNAWIIIGSLMHRGPDILRDFYISHIN